MLILTVKELVGALTQRALGGRVYVRSEGSEDLREIVDWGPSGADLVLIAEHRRAGGDS